jgi:hypothetical protein
MKKRRMKAGEAFVGMKRSGSQLLEKCLLVVMMLIYKGMDWIGVGIDVFGGDEPSEAEHGGLLVAPIERLDRENVERSIDAESLEGVVKTTAPLNGGKSRVARRLYDVDITEFDKPSM